MNLRNQVLIWIGFFVFLILSLWIFRGILLPFVVGAALAYLLNPLVNQLQKLRINRGWATALVLASVVVIVIGLFVMLLPMIIQQVVGLVQRLPGYAADLEALVRRWAPELSQWLGPERAAQVERSVSDILGQMVGLAGILTQEIVNSGMTLISLIGFTIFTPVVAFYLLLDWDSMVRGVHDLLPRRHRAEILGILRDIDSSMAGVIRGQGGVLLIDAAFYSVSLSLIGLNFGLAVGLIAGLLSFIPYVGFGVGFTLSMGIAIVQFWPNWWMVAGVGGIFLGWQFIEGNILYPKLVGGSININPVWLMFALLAFGALFGFVGLLLAVPLAAIGGVLVRFAIRKYKASSLYLGSSHGGHGGSPTA
ncbi:Predicted PurR-regulated permease PerM [Devosia crocina]|uniref:Predicted PurR-regulated permease PerM n=1 Tax=Devosia crocina TaxID=429728 RepID=A0A1I7NBB1_9HYPH|nr:AI-2E family transporter [Devosia crocina]SFV31967.1 Predicted PurR-regulated permease PerM [Devosia crocina]